MKKSFRQWEISTDVDANFRVKRTQILMALRRGYMVPEHELLYLSRGGNARRFIHNLTDYYRDPSESKIKSLTLDMEEFLEDSANQSNEEFITARDIFSDTITTIMQSQGGAMSFRDAMKSNYWTGGGGNQKQAVFVYVNYEISKKTRSTEINRIITSTMINETNVERLILIIANDYETEVVNAAKNFRDQLEIEIFTEDRLRFDPVMHKLQPRFKVLSERDSKNFFTRVGYTANNLPKVLRKDACVEFLGHSTGPQRIVLYSRVTRLNQIAETGVYGRVIT
jgi:DNA-directed RNA polymerase subunit H (RpoH/RPB5)